MPPAVMELSFPGAECRVPRLIPSPILGMPPSSARFPQQLSLPLLWRPLPPRLFSSLRRPRLLGETLVYFRRFDRMDPVIILVDLDSSLAMSNASNRSR